VTFAIATTVALGATPSTMTMTQDTTSPLVRRPKTSRFSVFAQDEQPPAERLAAERAMRHASDALASSTDAQTRERAVMELAASGQPDTIRPLETALADADQDVREKAALALGLISSPDVIPGLLKAMADPDAQVREKAAIGLALRRDSRVADALIAAMDDSDAQVREKAAIALATSGDPRASGALERALQDPDSQVREKAATGLLLARSAAVDPTRGDQARESLRRLIGGLLMLAR
jgi:HEAT repeat protein